MGRTLEQQAEQLYREFSELTRRYQFRDRDQICYYGISVSQSHALHLLDVEGDLTMTELSQRLYLELSTVTRLLDGLVDLGLVVRQADEDDRRVCRVQLTPKGRKLLEALRCDLIAEKVEILKEIPPASREAVIQAVQGLLAAFAKRQHRLKQENGGR